MYRLLLFHPRSAEPTQRRRGRTPMERGGSVDITEAALFFCKWTSIKSPPHGMSYMLNNVPLRR